MASFARYEHTACPSSDKIRAITWLDQAKEVKKAWKRILPLKMHSYVYATKDLLKKAKSPCKYRL